MVLTPGLIRRAKGNAVAWANEPAGYTTINDQPWDLIAIGTSQPSQGWVGENGDEADYFTIITDAASPMPSQPNHNIVQALFPSGNPGGTGPFNIRRDFATGEQFKNMYVGMWIKHSANFDNTNGNSGTKFMWPIGETFGVGGQTYTGHNGSTMDFAFFQQGRVDRILDANLNATQAQMNLRLGQWDRYEWLMKANTADGTANGEVHVWISGVKTHQYTNVDWSMETGRKWLGLKWNPTYGGGTNPVPHDQWQYCDHIHISGSNT